MGTRLLALICAGLGLMLAVFLLGPPEFNGHMPLEAVKMEGGNSPEAQTQGGPLNTAREKSAVSGIGEPRGEPGLLPAAPRRELPFSEPGLSSFSLCMLGTGTGPTLLVIGGIQGDEPGGFSAASLLATHYTVTSGSVWVVPGLNTSSIFTRSRGRFGDMNRKFAHLDETDPEYAIVARIKAILLDDAVDLVLNLHDGSGFFRPTNEGPLYNPRRWGQSVIIDQDEVSGAGFSGLLDMARKAEADVNASLLHPRHRYHIRNTNTRLGDKEMEKTLSYFAVCNGKPAFGIEASKEFSTEYRAYYHLLVIESFMRQMGIPFERSFPLSPSGVLTALNSGLTMAAFDNRLVLALDDPRPVLNLLPFRKGHEPQARSTKPLLGMIREKEHWRVAYGNRTLTRVKPLLLDFDESLERIDMVVDGKPLAVPPGEVVGVGQSFMVRGMDGYRVNAIGAQKDIKGSESDVLLKHGDFIPRYSMDKAGAVFRVEIYKGEAFAGMVLVRFGEEAPSVAKEPMTASKGPESELGF